MAGNCYRYQACMASVSGTRKSKGNALNKSRLVVRVDKKSPREMIDPRELIPPEFASMPSLPRK